MHAAYIIYVAAHWEKKMEEEPSHELNRPLIFYAIKSVDFLCRHDAHHVGCRDGTCVRVCKEGT